MQERLMWWWWGHESDPPLGCIQWWIGSRWWWWSSQDRQRLTSWHRKGRGSPGGYQPGSHNTQHDIIIKLTTPIMFIIPNICLMYTNSWWCKIPFWTGWWCLRRCCGQPTPLSQCKWLQGPSRLALQLQRAPGSLDSPLPDTQKGNRVTDGTLFGLYLR